VSGSAAPTGAIRPCPIPEGTLLAAVRERGAWADCFVADIAMPVSHAEFVEAFYTSALFKLERRLLAWFASRPSTDAEASQLARGERDAFAAWRVEGRAPAELLLADYTGATKSWLMTAAIEIDGRNGTRLHFGSAIVPRARGGSREPAMSPVFHALLGFHKLYSRALLRAAASRLLR
jgi:hypothetical protein